MILSLDIRDYGRVQHMFRRYPRARFGLAMPYSQGATYAGILAQGENLFISAHGSPESIGHPDGSVRFTPQALSRWLEESVLPCNYLGEIYLAVPGSTQSYLDTFAGVLGPDFQDRIHGVFNLAYSQIIPPGHTEWLSGEIRVDIDSARVRGVA